MFVLILNGRFKVDLSEATL